MSTVQLFNTLCALVHGASGVGKSRLIENVPFPAVVIDAENGSRFIRARKIAWDPFTEPVPVADGTWDVAIVAVRDWNTAYKAYATLATGQHPFNSVVIDSITELQRNLLDDVAGINQPTIAQRGEVLRTAEDFVRKIRDLNRNPVRPIQCVLLLALTEKRDGVYKSNVSGKLAVSMPGFVDVVGYMFVENGTPGDDGVIPVERKMLISAHPSFEAKDRTDILCTHYGPVIVGPKFTEMISVIEAAQQA